MPTDVVACASFRRLNDQIAFGYTSMFLRPHIGGVLQDVPELKESGAATRRKVADILDERLTGGVSRAE